MLDWNDPSKIDENRSLIIRTLREVVKRVVVEFRLLSSPLNASGRANQDGVVEAVPVSFRPPSTSQKMYYHHLKSGKVFRSVAEVVNFFMYEVYPDKPASKSYLGPIHFSGFKKERKRKGVSSLKKKIEEYERKNKAREKWAPMFFDINNNINNGDNKREENHHRHIPMFDLNDDHQREEEEEVQQERVEDYYYEDNQNLMYDVVGDNYNVQQNEAYDQKETVEKFLADSYNNLMNLPNTNNNDAKKSKSFSFDINKKFCEEEEEEEDQDAMNKRAVEQFLAEAYDNLMNLHNNNTQQPTSRKGKEKMSASSIEKPRRKKAKSFPPTSSPFPNTSININSIPLENIPKPMESMEVQQPTSIPNMKLNHFNFLEENRANNFLFTDICESSAAPAARASERDGSGSSSASFHVDECDLINHIPESSDMFDLAIFLAKNRGGNNGGF
ncbi:hypothetical protein E5676_scaffold500G00390 [Cucumis melo var. makuwa]|uniref:Uncharacterized protein n=1 Tax=Cucumis melo var. makuwa TaxID=1194695 RepID=A0A5A7STU2_CUCMM|nr:hypothetical protein E6C27_scaffold184G00400 [Cucumis melo var. makuwa]TYK23535.1 hypothetical protein E5676_scaffold500G00390 [Cucumis melo var. makuwa]